MIHLPQNMSAIPINPSINQQGCHKVVQRGVHGPPTFQKRGPTANKKSPKRTNSLKMTSLLHSNESLECLEKITIPGQFVTPLMITCQQKSLSNVWKIVKIIISTMAHLSHMKYSKSLKLDENDKFTTPSTIPNQKIMRLVTCGHPCWV